MLRYKRHIALYFTVLFIGLSTVAGAEDQRKIVLEKSQLHESFLGKVNVSGGVRAGLMYKGTLQMVDFDKLYVYFRQGDKFSNDTTLCVNMVSQDGRYSSSWEHLLDKQVENTIVFSLRSEHKEQISKYASSELVVLASVAQGGCSSNDKKYVPTSWGFTEHSDYILFVNSGGTDTVIGIPGRRERVPCEKIIDGSAIAYDTKCVVGKELLEQAKNIYLVRNNFSNKLPEIKIPLR